MGNAKYGPLTKAIKEWERNQKNAKKVFKEIEKLQDSRIGFVFKKR